ncbi:histidine acid phosphatase domain containing 1 [Loa loa]|uniref:Inositol hexakisphosphate and diphosphoinositol-pentakisphosphate kinase n=1 Tax=Loa loa TaxID=7209 RepID=A0A1S0ULY9_LOALO|nr:histidine acid phosphatase domain containing 1 [Loa loa]EJD76368.1 histidine acid phosphatase domain containing 1 [Loa loa]
MPAILSSRESAKKIIIGVCTMKRKATSKPMQEIMTKIVEYYADWLEFVVFPEEVILNESVERWPLCDCLISFHATDFPLHKAIEYERLRHPYVLNDLHRQYDLLDRRKVFRTLARAGIEHPRHGVLLRDKEGKVEGTLKEFSDHIEVNGMMFNKPFVEKPLSAEDHNVYIYYPSSVGGGSQRLFRKINNRSSWYSPVSTVRREGSYIYEDFIPADGTDVKVYAVGPYYAHAEARKAPGLDGKVERDSHGKEVRYPVILSSKEKLIARKVVMAFGQTVCGFDLLRANGKSFVCDVNGFSFVKTSTKYYEDTAKILGNTILRRLASSMSIPWQIPYQDDDPPLVSTPSGKIMELRCVIAIIRHGDRTPKQKMKIVVTDQRFFDLFKKYNGYNKNEIKMKRPNQLMEVLELAREILHEQQVHRNESLKEMESCEDSDGSSPKLERDLEQCEEAIKKWDQVRTVLEMYGHFSGINRKVQLKYLKPREVRSSDDEEMHQQSALMLILKWGGELTTAGNLQAEALGKLFRTLYPGIRRTDGKSCPEDTQGLGFLRLHSTYRHDLKIYASDEGRVQMTAAAFAKGLLALEGELTPILMQMVKSANTDGLLDDDVNARDFQQELKCYLHSALQVNRDWTTEDHENLNPSGIRSLTNAMEFIKNPRKMCEEIASYVQQMVEIIQWCKCNKSNRSLYLNESWDLAERRWAKELQEFRRVNKNGDVEFDISKIPDIYDNIKYDMEHNPELCISNEGQFERMYLCAKNMADIVVPQEYGISEKSKVIIGQHVCTPLLKKIKSDLYHCVENPSEDDTQTRLDPRASQGIATPLRHVRTRLYFTSESHIHTIMNLIKYGGLCKVDDKKWQRAMHFLSSVTEYNYMTQVVLMVYEDSRTTSTKQGTDRFHIELLFSPGLYPCFLTEKERIYETRFPNSSSKQSSGPTGARSKLSTRNCATSTASLSSVGVAGGEKGITDSGNSAFSGILVNNGTDGSHSESSSSSSLNNLTIGKASAQALALTKKRLELNDSEDDLNDESVNLVALDEVASGQYTTDELARHSPGSLHHSRRRVATNSETRAESRSFAGSCSSISDLDMETSTHGTTSAESHLIGLMKSMSDMSCKKSTAEINWDFASPDDPASAAAEAGNDPRNGRNSPGSASRRPRFPYCFKHHTVSFLTELDNRLISTDVLFGKSNDSARRRLSNSPAVLSTAVIARSSSAPRLQTYKAEDEISVGEIRRFWPPLRSLETLHDNIRFSQLDRFLERLMKIRTPIPSPPKTPISSNRMTSVVATELSDTAKKLERIGY